jgi:prepilin-type N-terminal cleavage/methylation domain-containing protein
MGKQGFSFLELLVAIAVIAILSAILIPQISGVREAGHAVTARQQQAELQTALGNWIVAKSSGAGGLAAARDLYTGKKLDLLEDYLQASTYGALVGDGDTVSSEALDESNAYLQFSDWTDSSVQPVVEWKNK